MRINGFEIANTHEWFETGESLQHTHGEFDNVVGFPIEMFSAIGASVAVNRLTVDGNKSAECINRPIIGNRDLALNKNYFLR